MFKTDTLIPSLLALAFVASQLNTFAALTRALRAIVEEDLRTDFFQRRRRLQQRNAQPSL